MYLPKTRETMIFLLILPAATPYPSVIVDPGQGPEHILTRSFSNTEDAWTYVHQYTVNANDRQFRLVVTDYTGR
jgi:hypothetical protein